MQTPTHLVSRCLPNLGCAKRFLPTGLAAPGAGPRSGAEALRKSGVIRSVEVRRFSNEAKNPFTFNTSNPRPGPSPWRRAPVASENERFERRSSEMRPRVESRHSNA
jgi:hypothetical protein